MYGPLLTSSYGLSQKLQRRGMDPSLRRVAEMKPPAKIDGLLQFRKDVAEHFTSEERAAIWKSESGTVVRNAFFRCEGHNKQYIDTRQKLQGIVESGIDPSSDEATNLKRETILKKLKFVDCLAFMMNKHHWNQYTMCWVQTVGSLSQKELRRYQEQGSLEIICRAQRETLEREIGHVVSRSVHAGDSVALEIERNLLPLW